MRPPAPGGLALALAGSYAHRVLGAALLALPAQSAIGGSGIRSFARGDARLFEPGGLYLLEVALSARQVLAESLGPTLALALAVALVGLIPECWVVRALGPSPPLARGLPRLLALLSATWGARLLLGLLTLGLALTARSFFAGARDERLPLLAMASVGAVGLALQVVVSFWRDLAEVEIIGRGASARGGVLGALSLARAAGGSLVARYAAVQLLGLGALLGAASAVSALEVARGETWRALLALLVHQLAVLATLGLRAAWLWSIRRALDALPRGSSPRPPQAEAFL